MHNDQHNEHMILLNIFIILTIIILGFVSMFIVRDPINQNYNSDIYSYDKQGIIAKKSWGHHLKDTTPLTIVLSKAPHEFNSYNQESANQVISNLKSNQYHYGIKHIVTPADDLATQHQLTSNDNKTQLIKLDVSNKIPLRKRITQLKKAIKVPELKTYVTGYNVVQNTNEQSIIKAQPIIELIVGFLLFIILAFAFKAWILPILTVGSIWISLELSRNISLIINQYIHPHTSFMSSGSGIMTLNVISIILGTILCTDYWIHFKHEISKKHSNSIRASKISIKQIMHLAIGITICALISYALINPIDSISIILMSILSCLAIYICGTLTGKGAFWTLFDFSKPDSSKRHVSKDSIITVGCLVIIALIGGYFLRPKSISYDLASNLDNRDQAKQGLLLADKHFSAGHIDPTYIYIKSSHKLNNESNMKQIDTLTQQLHHNDDINSVESITQPTGRPINQLYIQNQLSLLTGKSIHSQASLAKIDPSLHGSDLGASQLRAIADSAQNIDQHLQKIQSIEDHNKMSRSFSDEITTSSQNTLNPSQRQLLTNTSKQLAYIAKDTANVGNNTKIFGSQLSKLQSEIAQVNSGLIKLNSGFQKSNNYLASLQKSSATNVYYIPNVILRTKYNQPLREYMSQNKHATIIKVSLKSKPSSIKNQKITQSLLKQTRASLKGTKLNYAKVRVFGESVSAYLQRKQNHKNFQMLMLSALIIMILFTIAYGSLIPCGLLLLDGLLTFILMDLLNLLSKDVLNQIINASSMNSIIILSILITSLFILVMMPRLTYKHHNELIQIIDTRLSSKLTFINIINLSIFGISISSILIASTSSIQIGIALIIVDIFYYLLNPYLLSGMVRFSNLINNSRH